MTIDQEADTVHSPNHSKQSNLSKQLIITDMFKCQPQKKSKSMVSTSKSDTDSDSDSSWLARSVLKTDTTHSTKKRTPINHYSQTNIINAFHSESRLVSESESNLLELDTTHATFVQPQMLTDVVTDTDTCNDTCDDNGTDTDTVTDTDNAVYTCNNNNALSVDENTIISSHAAFCLPLNSTCVDLDESHKTLQHDCSIKCHCHCQKSPAFLQGQTSLLNLQIKNWLEILR